MKEYLVTGATGFIGRRLLEKMVELNLTPIKIITRNKNNAIDLINEHIEVIEGDISDRNLLINVINENTVIFHLAAFIDITNKYQDLIYQTNYEGTKNIVDVAIMKKAHKVIYSSSSSVIHSEEKVIKEPKQFNVTPLIGHYAKSKAMATNYFLNKTKEGLNGVVVYPTAVYGISSTSTEINDLINKYIKGRFPFYIKGSYNFVDNDDVVSGIISAYYNGKIGEDYILSGYNLTIKELFKTIDKVTNKRRFKIKIPLFVVYSVLPFFYIYYTIFRKRPFFTATSLKIINQNSNFDNTKAIKSLDYNITDISVSLMETVRHLNNKK